MTTATTSRLADLVRIYEGSDGAATTRLYDELAALGPAGEVALNLFRANKCSERAKSYRGGIPGKGTYRAMAYNRKEWSMANLCRVLMAHADALGIRWGWQRDPAAPKYVWALYSETPVGQVSFHTEYRGQGPDYPGQWDGVRGASVERILQWTAGLLE